MPASATASATGMRRLPGIRFEPQPPPPEDVLPRMDIAGFVGFAATGPLDVPVAIEDMAQFRNVFGEGAPLFWDAVSEGQVSAHLASAVRAFFQNGGRRCWVVRVAGRRPPPDGWRQRWPAVTAASRARFPVPGLAWMGRDLLPEQAELMARGVGSWADELSVAAGLLSAPLDLVPESLQTHPGLASGSATDAPAVSCLIRGRNRLRPGDLVRVTYRDGGDQLLFAVASLSAAPPGSSPAGSPPAPDGEPAAVHGAAPLWLRTRPVGGTAETPLAGRWRPGGQADAVPVAVWDEPGGEPGAVRVGLPVPVASPAASAPPAGTAITLDLDRVGRGLLIVEQARAVEQISSPPGALSLLSGLFVQPSLAPPPELTTPGHAEVLTFELRARIGVDQFVDLGDLGFHPGHERYAGALPSDEQLYGSLLTGDDPHPRLMPPLWAQAATPRFPLAGHDDGGRSGRPLYPIGMESLGGRFVRVRAEGRPGLERDGLAAFDAGLFLDPGLAGVDTGTLIETADFLRYQSEHPRELRGIHALLGIDEITVVAVPDTVHPGWRFPEPSPTPAPPKHEHIVQPSDCRHLGRRAAADAADSSPDRDAVPTGTPSQAVDFEDCWVPSIAPPQLLPASADPLGNIVLAWRPVRGVEGNDPSYVLEETIDSRSWEGAAQVYRGPESFVELYGRSPGVYFYRVRAVTAEGSSDWSQALVVPVTRGEPWTRRTAGEADPTLLAVHRALVRMCAARGDLLGVLSVPEHYREDDAVAHVTRLRGGTPGGTGIGAAVPPLAGEERTLSFGALYHPWTVTPRDDRRAELSAVPPDGAAAGILARRALLRGAWVAPANEPLSDVVALTPPIRPASHQRLQDGRVNTLRQGPRGFLWLSADTLSDDADLRHVSVRRLLSLLRRVALRHGPTYVFEPNDDAFRRRIRRGFEAILAELLTRGAFAGTTPDEAFRVTTASPPNTPQSLDQGRLIIELKVAPSIPMRFLTVRLIQAADRGLAVEGA